MPKWLIFWLRTMAFSLGITVTATTLIALSSLYNHLEYHGAWISSKTEMKMGLMGSEFILKNGEALAGECVNLGVWYGFHELLFNRELLPERVSFRFMLAPDAVITCCFNKTADAFEGIRFSANPAYPSAYLRALDTGAFVEKQLLDLPSVIGESIWHESCLVFSPNQIQLSLDDKAMTFSRKSDATPGRVGFRAIYNDTFFDDVEIKTAGSGETYSDSFERRIPIGKLLEVVTISGLYVFFPVLYLVYLLSRQWRVRSRVFLVCYAAIIGGIILYFLQIFVARMEPITMPELIKGRTAFNPQQQVYARECQAAFEKEHLSKALESSEHIVFLGTSQTFGIGARNFSEGFVAQLQNLFDRHTVQPKRIECFNGGIAGSVSRYLYQAYSETYIKVRPTLTVVNLSCNDYWNDTPDFAESLRNIVGLNKASGIKTLFVLEAASPDVFPNGYPTHKVMASVAAETGTPLVNAHEFLKARRDDGFLFWDQVHPTSYGHRLLAEFLYSEIMPLLEGRPAQ